MNYSERIKAFCQSENHKDEVSLVHKLRDGGLSEAMIVVVIDALESTCEICRDNELRCRCWNDE